MPTHRTFQPEDNRRGPEPLITLLGMPRDDVHQHPARCSECGRCCYLGPRQRSVWLESQGDARVVCWRCVRRRPVLRVAHLGNTELTLDGSWAPAEVRLFSPLPDGEVTP